MANEGRFEEEQLRLQEEIKSSDDILVFKFAITLFGYFGEVPPTCFLHVTEQILWFHTAHSITLPVAESIFDPEVNATEKNKDFKHCH